MVKRKRQPRRKRTQKRKRGQRGNGLLSTLKGAAKIGLKLGKSKDYKRLGVLGVGGKSHFRRKPWEV